MQAAQVFCREIWLGKDNARPAMAVDRKPELKCAATGAAGGYFRKLSQKVSAFQYN